MPNLFFNLQRMCSVKKSELRKFHRKTPVLESPFIKVAGFGPKVLQRRFFPVKFAKLLRTPILYSICKNGCFWFLQAFNLDMLQDKRRRFNRIFQKDESNPPPKKAYWKYPLRIVIEFFKDCHEYLNIEIKSLKMLWGVVQFSKVWGFQLFQVYY